MNALLDALRSLGVDVVYGMPGGAIGPMYDALLAHPEIRVVHVRHETSAAFMAIGHARTRPDSLPCVLATSGPGVTNAVTGLAAADGEGAPLLMIGGEVPREKFGRGALQEGSPSAIDVVSLVRGVTRSAESMVVPSGAVSQLVAGAQRALQGRRGPVFFSLPLDVAVSPVARSTPPRLGVTRPVLDEGALDDAARALRSARAPLVLVGSGARGAAAGVRALVERLRLPVMTSPKAKGLVPETAPYCLGVFGYGGHPSATEHLTNHKPDTILALGCGLNEPSTNTWSSLLQASRCQIQVDIDPAKFGRNYRVDIPIHADCADAVAALDARLADAPARDASHEGIRYFPPKEPVNGAAVIGHARAIRLLQEELPSDTIYTADIGEHLLFAIHYLRVTAPDQFIISVNLGSMGSGIGAAIGAAFAAPERTVVSISGDFGFQMYGCELATCVQERLRVLFVIMNDSRMRMVEAGLQRNYGRALPMNGPPVDFAMIATAHGARGFVVRTEAELREALRSRSPDGPTVLDVRVDPGAVFPANARAQEFTNYVARKGQG